METTLEKTPAFIEICKSFGFDHNEIPEITSFESACNALGIKTDVPDVSALPEKHQKALIAHYKLIIIAEALNQGWTPNYNDYDEWKYFPWFEVEASEENPSGSGFSRSDCDYWNTHATVGSRLCFRTKTLAKYAGRQFEELYKDYFLIG